MANRTPLTDADGEVRELTGADLRDAKLFSSLPESLQAKLRGLSGRGPQKEPTKERITIRLDAEVVAHFRATGAGWQTRINEALKEQIEQHRT